VLLVGGLGVTMEETAQLDRLGHDPSNQSIEDFPAEHSPRLSTEIRNAEPGGHS
jgi:hypothetical protein